MLFRWRTQLESHRAHQDATPSVNPSGAKTHKDREKATGAHESEIDVAALIATIDAAMQGPQFEPVWERIFDQKTPGEKPVYDQTVVHLVDSILSHFERFRPAPTAFPAIASNIVNMTQADALDVAKLTTMIKQDAAIATHILRVANSVFYRRTRPASDIASAVVRIGTREVMQIASGIAAKSLFDVDIRAEFAMFRPLWDGLFRRAMTIAYSASWFSLLTAKSRPECAFLAGMLHDFGKTIALRTFCALMREKALALIPSPAQLNSALELVHARIGSEMMQFFGLPKALSEICAHHHDALVLPHMTHDDIHIVRILSGLLDLRLYTPSDVVVDEIRQSLIALAINKDIAHEAFEELGESAIYVGHIF